MTMHESPCPDEAGRFFSKFETGRPPRMREQSGVRLFMRRVDSISSTESKSTSQEAGFAKIETPVRHPRREIQERTE